MYKINVKPTLLYLRSLLNIPRGEDTRPPTTQIRGRRERQPLQEFVYMSELVIIQFVFMAKLTIVCMFDKSFGNGSHKLCGTIPQSFFL